MEPDKTLPDEPDTSPIMPEAEARRRPVFDPTGRVEQINPNEIKIADVRRHPVGLFFLYLQTILALAIAFGLIVVLMPSFADVIGLSDSASAGFIAVLSLAAIVFAFVFLILATRIYRANQLIVTTDNVTHVAQVDLFHRKISEVSMANVEDVTAHQDGIFPTFLNYGRLHVETAGEQNNLDFHYCPNPNAYAKAIQDARVEFIKVHGD